LNGQLIVSSSPHARSLENTKSIMLDVIIALIPVAVIGVFYFGMRALLHIVISVTACVFFEYLYEKLLKKPVTVNDLSAVVTGLLLSFNISVIAPLWLTVVGALFAVVLVKQLYGGIGKNFLNPALAARAFLFSWPVAMTAYVETVTPFDWKSFFSYLPFNSADVVTTATPLVALKAGTLPDKSLLELFLGVRGGCIGETSAILLLVGGLYLIYRKVINPVIPLTYIGTVAVLSFFFGKIPFSLEFTLYQILSGGLMLGAIFMATDYATSPSTNRGRFIFALGAYPIPF